MKCVKIHQDFGLMWHY